MRLLNHNANVHLNVANRSYFLKECMTFLHKYVLSITGPHILANAVISAICHHQQKQISWPINQPGSALGCKL